MEVSDTQAAEAVLRNYIRAKDENRAHLLDAVFSPDACLEVRDATGTMALAGSTRGGEAIAELLVRRFAQRFENIYTFCLARPPASACPWFECGWLAAMSDKDSRRVRVGCGRYGWGFEGAPPRLANRLVIDIDAMQSLPAAALQPVLGWLRQLDYPWTSAAAALGCAPAIDALQPVLQALRHAAQPADGEVGIEAGSEAPAPTVSIGYQDLESAFDWVAAGPPMTNAAYISRLTGQVFYHSADHFGEEEELPDDIDDAGIYLSMPHKNDLDLGRRLVLRFVDEHLRDDFDTVRSYFARRGAYGRFKDLLARRGKLDAWHAFEQRAIEQALREWARDNGIEIIAPQRMA